MSGARNVRYVRDRLHRRPGPGQMLDVAALKAGGEQRYAEGLAPTSCTVPSKGTPTFDLPDDQMEMGVGVHGEPGRKRMPLKGADEITDILAEAVITDLPFKRGDEVWVLVNGLGGTPLVELYVMYNRLHDICEKEGIRITRNLIGNYVTSLDMAGASITLLKLDDDLTKLWDAPVKTTALRWGM